MKVQIECPCGHKFFIDFDHSDLSEDQREERKMGDEIAYTLEKTIECPQCGKLLDEISIYEYPEGCYYAICDKCK